MPASLTIQVRLGFSMGWRIWTPNEVGFYAKTLAHSYFILVILKSKFLKELIWIVNYNLFMGTKKYHVFIEYLKFGMKSKEEKCFWKKIIYISMVVRHKRLTQRFFNYKKQRHKILMYRAKLYEVLQQRKERTHCWKSLEVRAFKRARSDFIKMHKRASTISMLNLNLHSFKFINKWISNKKYLKSRSKFKVWRYLSLSRKKTPLINRIFEKFQLKPISKIHKNYKFNTYKIKPSVLNICYSSNICKFKKYKKKATFKLGNIRPDKIKGKHSTAALAAKTFFSSLAEKTVLEEFRFDPVLVKNKYSVCGGPRKRLSRNLRRAYKGKYIKHITDLVWFWEKLSRMMTYYLQTFSLKKKNII